MDEINFCNVMEFILRGFRLVQVERGEGLIFLRFWVLVHFYEFIGDRFKIW